MLLNAHLLPPARLSEDRLLGRGAPVESFGTRIELARRLNLLNPEVSKSLDWMRDIRNDASHRQKFSFSENSVKDRVDNVIAALDLKTIIHDDFSERYRSPKGKFIACTLVLIARIQIETSAVQRASHEPSTNTRITFSAKDA